DRHAAPADQRLDVDRQHDRGMEPALMRHIGPLLRCGGGGVHTPAGLGALPCSQNVPPTTTPAARATPSPTTPGTTYSPCGTISGGFSSSGAGTISGGRSSCGGGGGGEGGTYAAGSSPGSRPPQIVDASPWSRSAPDQAAMPIHGLRSCG